MNNNPSLPQRKSIRLQGYDYTLAGAYFITLVTWQRECLFGKVVAGEMQLTKLGEMVASEWKRLEKRFPAVELDEWVVMPNHFHGIIVLTGNMQRDHNSPTRKVFVPRWRAPSQPSSDLSNHRSPNGPRGLAWVPPSGIAIIMNMSSGTSWNYGQIRLYIQDNPRRWTEDEENLSRL